MPAGWVAAAVAAVGVISSSMSAEDAEDAQYAQTEAARQAAAEQNNRLVEMRELLSPYVEAGTDALTGQRNLIGLGGAAEQQKSIDAISSSPQFGALAKQGEDAMLQNASATGGLRGGNIQGALSQFRPQLLNSLIEQQYNRLSGISSLGQNAAAGVGNAGISTGQGVSGLLQQQGAAQAGGALAGGQAQAQALGGISSAIGQYVGGGGTFGFGGSSAPATSNNYSNSGFSDSSGTF